MAQRNPLVLVSGQQQQLQAADYANIGIPYLMFKNRLINGDFNVWQRGTVEVSINASGTYYPDRWVYTFNGSGAGVNSQRLAFTPGQTAVPDNPQYYVENSISLGATGQTELYMSQRIEGVGTFSGQDATVSFWAKADTTRTLGVSLDQSFGTGGSPSSSVHTSGTTFTLSTTWTKYSYTFSVPSISGKTIGTNGNDYLAVNLEHPINSGFTIDIAHVQFEQGENATQFEYRPIATELSLCQRYYERWQAIEVGDRYGVGLSISTTSCRFADWLTSTKRALPTVSVSSPSDFTIGYNGGSYVCSTVTGFPTKFNVGIATTNAALPSSPVLAFLNSVSAATWMDFSAEL